MLVDNFDKMEFSIAVSFYKLYESKKSPIFAEKYRKPRDL